MQLLIEARCDIEAKDKYGMSPILMAAWHGHKDAVQLLIKCGANALVVNKVSTRFYSNLPNHTQQENIFYEKTLSAALFLPKAYIIKKNHELQSGLHTGFFKPEFFI